MISLYSSFSMFLGWGEPIVDIAAYPGSQALYASSHAMVRAVTMSERSTREVCGEISQLEEATEDVLKAWVGVYRSYQVLLAPTATE